MFAKSKYGVVQTKYVVVTSVASYPNYVDHPTLDLAVQF